MNRLALLLGATLLSAAASAAPLRVMGFGGSSNWPLFVAQERGLFEREGVQVEALTAPDSATQLARLMQGRIDIALTSVDNVIAYREGQVEPMPAGDRDLVAFLGVNQGGRSVLTAKKGVRSIGELKGARVGVDAISTGYAFVLEEMLRRGGLARGDYELVSVGGSRQRWQSLRDGKVSATLLNAPLDATAEAEGFSRLGSTGDVVSRYQGSVGAARRAWAREHERDLVAFIRAYVAAVEWLYEAANAEAAQAILMKHQPRIGAEEARRSHEELLHPEHGSLSRRAAIDLEGVQAVLRLRREHAVPKRDLAEAEAYVDLTYYRKAIR